jgi:uncharacterized ferritin-like protein (DUF455 family)
MLGVDDTAIRLSNYLHVLRELVHLSCGHLALEPRFEVKALLADHLHDDARAVTKLRRRLDELRTPSEYPGAPSAELTQLLDRAADADTGEYLEIAYGELKPTLIAACSVHLQQLDPLLDEPGLRLLTQLRHRQERHTTELPAAATQSAFEDLGALSIRPGEARALTVMAPLERPARDAFVEIVDAAEPDGQQQFVHSLMDAELCAAELTARSSHEHPDMPWDFHVDMARQCWDEIRHAEVLDRLMATELGCHWGEYPVDLGDFEAIYALDLPGRLERLPGLGGRRDVIDRGHESVARVLDFLLADAASHARTGERWSTYVRERTVQSA